jgi:hypothetical protein
MQFPAFPGMVKNRTLGEIALFIGTMQAAALDPVAVATVIEFESARSWSPSIHGPKAFTDPPGYAVGLIQFAPSTARGLGTSTAGLEQMGFTNQLAFVVKYFKNAGIARLKRLVDYYAAVFWPAAIGTDTSFVIAKAGMPAYDSNKGLDPHGNGQITTGDLQDAMRGIQASAKGTIEVTPHVAGGVASPGRAIATAGLILLGIGTAFAIWRLRR